MNTTQQTLMQRIVKLGLILTMVASMAACSSDQHWKEEVQLSDGKVIVVERDLITESGGDEWALNRSGSKPKEYRIRFEYPDGAGKTVEWRSIKESPQTWPELPLILDVEANQPIIFTTVFGRGGCQVYSKYVFQNSAWIEEKLPPQFEKRTTNLQILNNKEGLPFIDLEHKRKKNSDVTVKIFQQVGPKQSYCK